MGRGGGGGGGLSWLLASFTHIRPTFMEGEEGGSSPPFYTHTHTKRFFSAKISSAIKSDLAYVRT